jgi:MFS family permease
MKEHDGEASMTQRPAARTGPLALRMAVIAFLNQNITYGCLWGSFSVLLDANEAHLKIGPALATMAVPAATLLSALCAPVVGFLVGRTSLRLLLLTGALMNVIGYGLLATTASFVAYLIAFGLFLGPGMAMAVVLPPTLVTRWYPVNAGRVLGITSTAILLIVMPLAVAWTLQRLGLTPTYWFLAGLSAIGVLANLFVIDHPSEADVSANMPTATVQSGGALLSMPQLLGRRAYWAAVLPAIASILNSMILTTHMVPMAMSWGLTATLGASLVAIQSLVGMFGNVAFGWLADRIGAAHALGVLLFDSAILWVLLLLRPSFAIAAPVIGLIGFHGAGMIPVLSVLLTETFGRENFSRSFGLMNLVSLPFSTLCVPAAAVVFASTGSYTGVIVAEALLLLLGAVFVTAASGPRAVPAGAPV